MIQPRGFQFSNLLLFVIHICFFRLIGLMNLEREPTFPPYEGDLSNQHLSFDQDQWKTNSQKGSCVSTELDSMENPPSSPDCVNGLSPYSEEITHRPDTVYSDSDDTVSNSQATTSLTWNQPSSEESYLEPPQGLYMDQEGTRRYPSLPRSMIDAVIPNYRSRAVNLNCSRRPFLRHAYNAALQTEPRVERTLNSLVPLVRSTAVETYPYGKPRSPRTRIPNNVKSIVLYLHDAYLSVYPDATVEDIADGIVSYLIEWG